MPVMYGTQQKTEAAPGPNFNAGSSAAFTETLKTETFYESDQIFQPTSTKMVDADMDYRVSTEFYNPSNEIDSFRRTTQSIHQVGCFEDIALPDVFLDDYFSQVTY